LIAVIMESVALFISKCLGCLPKGANGAKIPNDLPDRINTFARPRCLWAGFYCGVRFSSAVFSPLTSQRLIRPEN